MNNLSRLTLAAALLGGMALPALAQPGSPAVHATQRSRAVHVAATETAVKETPKTASKDAMKPATAAPSATAAPGKDAVVSKDAPASTATTTMTAKPAVPGQTVQAPTVAPKVN